MKEKFNQLFKDKLFLVMLVLGLLTIVAAAGVVTIQRGKLPGEENPYIQMQDPGAMIAEEDPTQETEEFYLAGNSNAAVPEQTTAAATEERTEAAEPSAYAASETQPEAAAPDEQPGTELAQAESAEPDAEASDAAQAGTGLEAATPLILDFSDASRLAWPVRGNILLDYSMDTTIYFPTLAQYQCNPGVVIQAEVSDPVQAPANARVMALGTNEEIGNYVILDLGNDYSVTCGQLKEIQVVENEYLEAGRILGYVAEPTKYYSIEGSNVYFELQHGDGTLDPLDYFE